MAVELSVIVPIFNEEDHLMAMAESLQGPLDEIVGPGRWQFVLADNGSTDATPEVVQAICRLHPQSCPLRLGAPNYGGALQAALKAAQGQWALIINVDWWDTVFIRWAWRNRERYDLILGSKRCDPKLNQMSRYRQTLSWGLNSVLQFVFGFVGTDTHGLKLIKLETMLPIVEQCVMRRGQFDTEMTLRSMRNGLWLAEVPVPVKDVRTQRNRMVKKITQNLIDILRLRKVMRAVPHQGPIRYHRWAREDMTKD